MQHTAPPMASYWNSGAFGCKVPGVLIASINGLMPKGSVLVGANGNLYGTATAGGADGQGVV